MIKVLAFPKNRFSGNPHISNFYAQIELNGAVKVEDLTAYNWCFHRFDIFHLHWPEFFIVKSRLRSCLRLAALVVLLLFLKVVGTKIVWTVHNLKPHEQNNFYPRLYTLTLIFLAKFLDRLSFFSEEARELVEKEYPFLQGIESAIIPIAMYNNYGEGNPKLISKLRKKFLGNRRGKILLCFGSISSYRDYASLISSFSAVNSCFSLVIVGASNDARLLSEIQQQSANDKRVHIIPTFIENAEVANYFGAADLVVQPFKSILNSGSVVLALSQRKPVLAPNMGSIKSLQNKVGSRVVHTYDSLTAEIIENALLSAKKPSPRVLEQFSLARVASLYEELYRGLLKKPAA